jgi:RHS repeat-associated protein
MIQMPHLPFMDWDFKNQLQATSRQVVNDGTPKMTYYVYDAAGQRVRKVTDRMAGPGETPPRMNERIYLGGFEVYREYDGSGEDVRLEREALHVMDGSQRVALVETLTVDDGTDVTDFTSVIRYQLRNYLGSATLEVDEQANVISYEEYHPFGTSAYRAGRSVAQVSLKRYRYTGKEKDEETGLYYHGARYYACWWGRWTKVDPIGSGDGVNRYTYVGNRPVTVKDPSGKFGIFDIFDSGPSDEELFPAVGEGTFGRRNTDAQGNLLESEPIVTTEDISEFAEDVGTAVSSAGETAGEFVFETTQALPLPENVKEPLAVAGATITETGTKFVGGALTSGVSLAGAIVEAPEKAKEGAKALGTGVRTRNLEAFIRGAGQLVEVAGTVADVILLGAGTSIVGRGARVKPGRPGSRKQLGPKGDAGGRITKKIASARNSVNPPVGKGRNVAVFEGEINGKSISFNPTASGTSVPKGFTPTPKTRKFKTAKGREFDSEVIGFEKIAEELDALRTSGIEPTGTITVGSDFTICSSCSNVISQFEKLFSGVKVKKIEVRPTPAELKRMSGR